MSTQLNPICATASVTLVALIILCLAWELLWRPCGRRFALALKALPLCCRCRVLKGSLYTLQWAAC